MKLLFDQNISDQLVTRLSELFLAYCFQVRVCLKRVARKHGPTIYELKQSLLDDYMRFQLSNPSIIFKNA